MMLDLAQESMRVFQAHLSFIVVAAVLSLIGRFVKKYIFTKERAAKGHWFWLWARRTLPFHPVVAAWIFGLLVKDPYYFTLAGFVSIWFFDVVNQVTKKAADFRVELFTDSVPPNEAAEALSMATDLADEMESELNLPRPPPVPRDR